MYSPLPHRRHGVAAFLLGLFLLCLPATSHAAEKGVQTDLTWGVSNRDQDRTVAGVQELGAKWMRITISWNYLEPSKGRYNPSRYDDAIKRAASSGAKIIATVYTAPSWASGVDNPESPPRDPADYADFLRWAATRWGDKIDAWEVWNEQNLWGFWSTGPSPAQYARLLKAAYPAVKGADPTAAVVYGGTSYNDYRFLEGAYAAVPELGDYYDALGTHPYVGDRAPEDVWYDSDGRVHKKSFASYRELREVMLAHGDDKPIWFTEFGWSTNTLPNWGVSAGQQADYLTRALRCVEQDPYVDVAIWYIYRNHGWAADADSWVDQLGLLNSDFSPKPAYAAFKDYTEGTQGCAYEYPPPQSEPADTPPNVPSLPPADEPGQLPDTPLTGVAAPPSTGPRLRSPMLTVRRALIRQGRLIVDGRVARGATGTVRGVATYEGVTHDFTARIDRAGRLRVIERLPGGADALSGWVGLAYGRNANFHGQWVILQAAARSPRLKLAPDAQATSRGQTRSVRGTVAPDARGSVVLSLAYRTASGAVRLVTRKSKIRGGEFGRSLRLPEGAEGAILYAVFPGDAARGISGSSRTLPLR